MDGFFASYWLIGFYLFQLPIMASLGKAVSECPQEGVKTPPAAMAIPACGDDHFRVRRWQSPQAAFLMPLQRGFPDLRRQSFFLYFTKVFFPEFVIYMP